MSRQYSKAFQTWLDGVTAVAEKERQKRRFVYVDLHGTQHTVALSNEMLAARAGVGGGTVRRLLGHCPEADKTKNPTVHTLVSVLWAVDHDLGVTMRKMAMQLTKEQQKVSLTRLRWLVRNKLAPKKALEAYWAAVAV